MHDTLITCVLHILGSLLFHQTHHISGKAFKRALGVLTLTGRPWVTISDQNLGWFTPGGILCPPTSYLPPLYNDFLSDHHMKTTSYQEELVLSFLNISFQIICKYLYAVTHVPAFFHSNSVIKAPSVLPPGIIRKPGGCHCCCLWWCSGKHSDWTHFASFTWISCSGDAIWKHTDLSSIDYILQALHSKCQEEIFQWKVVLRDIFQLLILGNEI